jgi:hypothetical protein
VFLEIEVHVVLAHRLRGEGEHAGGDEHAGNADPKRLSLPRPLGPSPIIKPWCAAVAPHSLAALVNSLWPASVARGESGPLRLLLWRVDEMEARCHAQ